MQKTNNSDLNKARLGILGGSGLYHMKELKEVQELTIETPFGDPSDKLKIGKLDGVEIIFLARHGRDHTFTPTEVPYQANIWALRALNVRWIIAPSAVGSLQEQVRPLDMVLPDQFIDRTHQRPLTFFSEGIVAHVSMADPFCPSLSKLVADVGESLMPEGRQLHRGGTYLAMEGPAFSTRAESNLYRNWGCSVIGMTNHTEARLAREAEIAYSSLCMVTDYDCWHQNHTNVTVDLVINNLRTNADLAQKIVREAAKRISIMKPPSKSHCCLKESLLTNKEKVPYSTRLKVDLFTKPYWGEIKSNS